MISNDEVLIFRIRHHHLLIIAQYSALPAVICLDHLEDLLYSASRAICSLPTRLCVSGHALLQEAGPEPLIRPKSFLFPFCQRQLYHSLRVSPTSLLSATLFHSFLTPACPASRILLFRDSADLGRLTHAILLFGATGSRVIICTRHCWTTKSQLSFFWGSRILCNPTTNLPPCGLPRYSLLQQQCSAQMRSLFGPDEMDRHLELYSTIFSADKSRTLYREIRLGCESEQATHIRSRSQMRRHCTL